MMDSLHIISSWKLHFPFKIQNKCQKHTITSEMNSVLQIKCSGTQMSMNLNSNLFHESLARISLVIFFFYLESVEPFHRVIQKEELWLYSNPQSQSYVSTTVLFCFIVFPLPFLPLVYHWVVKTKNTNPSYYKSDLISATLATTLLLPLTGVITDLIKVCVGRPRPDFAYRFVNLCSFFIISEMLFYA